MIRFLVFLVLTLYGALRGIEFAFEIWFRRTMKKFA